MPVTKILVDLYGIDAARARVPLKFLMAGLFAGSLSVKSMAFLSRKLCFLTQIYTRVVSTIGRHEAARRACPNATRCCLIPQSRSFSPDTKKQYICPGMKVQPTLGDSEPIRQEEKSSSTCLSTKSWWSSEHHPLIDKGHTYTAKVCSKRTSSGRSAILSHLILRAEHGIIMDWHDTPVTPGQSRVRGNFQPQKAKWWSLLESGSQTLKAR